MLLACISMYTYTYIYVILIYVCLCLYIYDRDTYIEKFHPPTPPSRLDLGRGWVKNFWNS